MKLKYLVNKDSILKEYLKECGISKSLGRKIKLYGEIYINNSLAKNHYPVKLNDEIMIILPEHTNNNINLVYKPITILYEDEWILIVEKEHDLAIQPSKKHQDDSLLARVLAYFAKENIDAYCHVVTRLDYATSGIVLIAKNAYMHNLLAKTAITKKYLAKVEGKMSEEIGSICLPIARDLTSTIKRKVDPLGKFAKTSFRLLAYEANESTYELTLITGRTHQIRVHLQHLGFAVIGDKLYEGKKAKRLYLHSFYLEFVHPQKGEVINVENYPIW